MNFNDQRTWGPTPKYDRVKKFKRDNNEFIVVAGPCSVESELHIYRMAKIVSQCNATHLRGGVYRAGTYPGESFGLQKQLLKTFHDAAKTNGLKNIVEILDIRLIDEINEYAYCFQVGARQMQNYALLRELGQTNKTVFLKRHPGATLDEFLGAAEHLLYHGKCNPVLIERGSSSHMQHVRWDLSLSTLAAIQLISGIPIICDASHGTGRSDLVAPMTFAGVAAGANGILVEVHDNPPFSLSDKDQAITPIEFAKLMIKVTKIRKALLDDKS